MKVTRSDVTIYRLEIEAGDTVFDVYDEVGTYLPDWNISIVNGAIEIKEPE